MNGITRRHIFQGAATALSATRVIGANDRIRVGVIGLGGRGSYHVHYYTQIPDCRLSALCDVNQSARERKKISLYCDFSWPRGGFGRNRASHRHQSG